MRKLPWMDCSRGAPLGRVSCDITNAGPVKMHLQLVKLDCSGYDEGGAYWGHRSRGVRLYWYWWDGSHPGGGDRPLIISGFKDAASRAAAKVEVRKRYPQATFYA